MKCDAEGSQRAVTYLTIIQMTQTDKEDKQMTTITNEKCILQNT